jgi:hypothetical protein
MEELAQQQTPIIGTLFLPAIHHLPLPSLRQQQPSTHQISHCFLTLSQHELIRVVIAIHFGM